MIKDKNGNTPLILALNHSILYAREHSFQINRNLIKNKKGVEIVYKSNIGHGCCRAEDPTMNFSNSLWRYEYHK